MLATDDPYAERESKQKKKQKTVKPTHQHLPALPT